VAICLIACVVSAQEPEAPPEAEPAETLSTTEQQVAVEAVGDEEIRERLQRILETTGRINDLGLRVENGVVFLTGQTGREEYKEWARNLVLRTQDVVAVVNNLEVVPVQEPLWDFAPAMGELRALWRATIKQLPLIVFGLALLLLTLVLARLTRVAAQPILRRRVEKPAVARRGPRTTSRCSVSVRGLPGVACDGSDAARADDDRRHGHRRTDSGSGVS
jgi:hypothetical protein